MEWIKTDTHVPYESSPATSIDCKMSAREAGAHICFRRPQFLHESVIYLNILII